MIKLYNTLTKQKEEFQPIGPPRVKMYTCGVTVYDDCHIGHARSLYIFDVIRRYLKYRGFDVQLVRNITDVDDKIINRARESNTDPKALVDKYIAAYYRDLGHLGVSKADVEPRATENIPEMIKHIQELVTKGFAYPTATGVYFSVRKFPGYGKLSGQSIDQMLEGVRKTSDETKNDPLDFALWKAAKDSEPFWESPWGRGRPGWHIECSVMSQKYLGVETLDIHAGGRDLVFPHHENEIAQSEALSGKPFAKYWIHHGLLTINQQKMSKSLGNFITIQDVLKKYPADVLKILYLQAHYSSPVDFSWEKMEAAKTAYEKILILTTKLDNFLTHNNCTSETPWSTRKASLRRQFFEDEFIAVMDDNFNTPKGLSVLFDMISACYGELATDDPSRLQTLPYAKRIIDLIARVFGLQLKPNKITHAATIESNAFIRALSNEEIEKKLSLRNEYKKGKNFSEADKIRHELSSAGIIIEDNKDGTVTWRLK